MNNRPIKFRAWDTKNKKWLTAVPSLKYLLDDEDECVSHHDIDPESAIYSYPHNLIGDTFDDRIIWQQFTGLKDSTGREIYEGDLVKTTDGISKLSVDFIEYQCGEVRWLREAFEVCSKEQGATRISVFSKCDCCPADLQIIGNIFENPELLA